MRGARAFHQRPPGRGRTLLGHAGRAPAALHGGRQLGELPAWRLCTPWGCIPTQLAITMESCRPAICHWWLHFWTRARCCLGLDVAMCAGGESESRDHALYSCLAEGWMPNLRCQRDNMVTPCVRCRVGCIGATWLGRGGVRAGQPGARLLQLSSRAGGERRGGRRVRGGDQGRRRRRVAGSPAAARHRPRRV